MTRQSVTPHFGAFRFELSNTKTHEQIINTVQSITKSYKYYPATTTDALWLVHIDEFDPKTQANALEQQKKQCPALINTLKVKATVQNAPNNVMQALRDRLQKNR